MSADRVRPVAGASCPCGRTDYWCACSSTPAPDLEAERRRADELERGRTRAALEQTAPAYRAELERAHRRAELERAALAAWHRRTVARLEADRRGPNR